MEKNTPPDLVFYRSKYPDLRDLNDDELAEHWDKSGQTEGRQPNFAAWLQKWERASELPEGFDGDEYLAIHADLSRLGWHIWDAAVHYVEHGSNEGRAIRLAELLDAKQLSLANLPSDFDWKNYLNMYPERRESGVVTRELAILDYLELAQRGQEPPQFDPVFYRLKYPNLSQLSDEELSERWSASGQPEERPPNFLMQAVDSSYYYSKYPDVVRSGMNAVTHFLYYGWKEDRNPSASFDTRFYLSHNDDVRDLGVNPLQHYLEFGCREGRKPKKNWNLADRAADWNRPEGRLPRASALEKKIVLIISDTQIEQCVTYRLEQKKKVLSSIGVKAFRCHTSATGLIQSYLQVASDVIIYRSAVESALMTILKESGLPIAFEFDDMILGQRAIVESGIYSSLTDAQLRGLLDESSRFRETAMQCDRWIVSTQALRSYYSSNEKLESGGETGLEHRIEVLPNFMLADARESASDTPKYFDFAFTSPSKSIDPELAKVVDFLRSCAARSGRPLKILVIGNEYAYDRLSVVSIPNVELFLRPYSSYERYIHLLSQSKYALIPLSASMFNEAKTAIRAFDCAIAGVLPLVSPVGQYRELEAISDRANIVIGDSGWGVCGANFDLTDATREQWFKIFRDHLWGSYGTEAAKTCFREVFAA